MCPGFSVMILFLLFSASLCNQRELPDLVVARITLTTTKPATPDSIILEAVIKNDGPTAAPPSEAAMRIGNEPRPRKYNIPALLPGAIHSIQRIPPPGTSQNFTLTVYVDFSGIVVESDETNNQKCKRFRK